MEVTPTAAPETTPLASTVAMVLEADFHVPEALFPEMEREVVFPTVVDKVPEMVPAIGLFMTVMAMEAVSLSQPPEPAMMYWMEAEPAATAVTSPDEETVATVGSVEAQVPPMFPFEEIWEVASMQMACVPERVPALGGAETVTIRVADCPETV